MASEDRSLSEFPRALEVLSNCLLMISNPDGLGDYDTNSALLTEVGRAILAVQYTQQLGNVSVFDAIKNTRVLSGTTTPTANEGANGQLYVKYETVSNVDNVVGMYFKKDGAWLEISLGGGGNTDYIECTQAQYDAWEQAGTLDPDTLYFITDGNIGNDIIDDSTASETTVYSSDKVEDLLSDKQDKSDNSLTTTDKTIVGAINELKDNQDSQGDMIFNLYDTNTQYYKGDTVEYFGDLYKCIQTPPSAGYSPSGSPTYWSIKNLSAQVSDVARCMSIRETFVANTSITDALASIITKYGKNSLMGGFIITGYGFVHFSLSFSDDGQGGGYVVANNKGTGSNTPAMYIVQYVNGTVTLGYI